MHKVFDHINKEIGDDNIFQTVLFNRGFAEYM